MKPRTRHLERHAFGPYGHPFADPTARGHNRGPGRGFGGGGRGRRRRRGDVRAGLLMLLAEEPRNGYQLMQAIEDRSGGLWRPSPGAVYPSLAQLEDEGLIRPIDRDGNKLFEITEAGREHLQERHDDTPPWEQSGESAPIGDLRTHMKQVAIAMAQVARAGNEDQVQRAAEVLSEARRKLYLILAEEEED
ncbi:MAG TPA: PadR family transcriptional regulator [Solirubrobacteraceae bacterium]|nr:PadR family transcriptional regulator [Solirubrobacteraceae bacterium]